MHVSPRGLKKYRNNSKTTPRVVQGLASATPTAAGDSAEKLDQMLLLDDVELLEDMARGETTAMSPPSHASTTKLTTPRKNNIHLKLSSGVDSSATQQASN